MHTITRKRQGVRGDSLRCCCAIQSCVSPSRTRGSPAMWHQSLNEWVPVWFAPQVSPTWRSWARYTQIISNINDSSQISMSFLLEGVLVWSNLLHFLFFGGFSLNQLNFPTCYPCVSLLYLKIRVVIFYKSVYFEFLKCFKLQFNSFRLNVTVFFLLLLFFTHDPFLLVVIFSEVHTYPCALKWALEGPVR